MEILIDDFILWLENEKKNGATKLLVEGTMVAPENGNKIIISTIKQM